MLASLLMRKIERNCTEQETKMYSNELTNGIWTGSRTRMVFDLQILSWRMLPPLNRTTISRTLPFASIIGDNVTEMIRNSAQGCKCISFDIPQTLLFQPLEVGDVMCS